ncbi:MAG: peptidylprolyl isomerase [Alkaliphilus sp.]|nr:peptidylprolyl isomerase [Alkaliphilus sp.]
MKDKKVLATVDGREILEQDIDLLLNSLEPEKAEYLGTEEGRKKLLNDLIAQELIYLDAVKNEFDKNEAFVREAQKMHDNFLKQFAMHRLLRDVAATEDEILDFYNGNKQIFAEPETTKASHILVDDKEQADKIIEEINDGLPFEEAAKKHSRCPSKANGGDLGYFERGKMVPEFEAAAFDMEIGEMSAPVKTQFGYHIIKLVDRKEENIKTFDEVKNQLSQQLTAVKQQKAYVDKTDELKKEYEIIINK